MERLRAIAARHTVPLISLLALGAILVRLPFVDDRGYAVDVRYFFVWAERMVLRGPQGFYDPNFFADYPPGFLYLLWGLGTLFDGETLRMAVKTIPLVADVGIVLLASLYLVRKGRRAAAVLAAALWAFNPAAIFGGTYWGQVDALGSLVTLAALLAAGERRWWLAGLLGGLAVTLKPQFALGLGVVGAAALLELTRDRHWRPIVATTLPAVAVILLIAAPFRYGPIELLALVRRASETYPFTSLFAFNGWSIVGGMFGDDAPFFAFGAALLVTGLLLSCVPLLRDRGPWTMLLCGTFAVAAFYFLPTRAHERYILPALVYTVPLIALWPKLLWSYLAVVLLVTATFVVVFVSNDFFSFVPPIEAVLLSRQGQIALALSLMTASVVLGWQLQRRASATA